MKTLILSAAVGLLIAISLTAVLVPGSDRRFEVKLPETDGTVTIVLKPLHPFLAEYSYHLILDSTSQRTADIELFPQLGGSPKMMLTWYRRTEDQGPFLKVQHASGRSPVEELVDLSDGAVRANRSEATHLNDLPGFEKYRTKLIREPGIKLGYIDDTGFYSAPIKLVEATTP